LRAQLETEQQRLELMQEQLELADRQLDAQTDSMIGYSVAGPFFVPALPWHAPRHGYAASFDKPGQPGNPASHAGLRRHAAQQARHRGSARSLARLRDLRLHAVHQRTRRRTTRCALATLVRPSVRESAGANPQQCAPGLCAEAAAAVACTRFRCCDFLPGAGRARATLQDSRAVNGARASRDDASHAKSRLTVREARFAARTNASSSCTGGESKFPVARAHPADAGRAQERAKCLFQCADLVHAEASTPQADDVQCARRPESLR